MLNVVLKKKSVDANVQAVAEGSSRKQTWKPLDRDGRETMSYHNKPRVTLGGLLKILIFIKSDKLLTYYLFERRTAV